MFASLIVSFIAVLSCSAASHASPLNATTIDVSDAGPNGPFTGGVATYFYQKGNPGACGKVNPDSALICAIDQRRFGTAGPESPLCGRQVKITNMKNKKTVQVTVADDCPTCQNENSIDLSVGAFERIATLSEGVVPIEWSFV